MKILYFHQHFTTPKGSSGTRSYEFARNLVSNGHEVIMVCGSFMGGNTGLQGKFTNNLRNGEVQGIKVIELNIPYSNKDKFFQRTIKFLKFSLNSLTIVWKHNFDILFATSTPLTASIPGIFSKLIRKGKFIFEVRDLWPELPKAMGVIRNPIIIFLLDILERIAYFSADGVIGLSPGITAGIKKKSVESKKIIMIPNGSDIGLFDDSKLSDLLDYPTGLYESDFIALYAGAHGKANGLNGLLRAAKELKDIEPKIKILLIGDGSEKLSLINFKNKNNLDNVFFMDTLPKIEVFAWMKRADLGLQILSNIPEFYYGTSPNKFFDYLSSGLPILVNYPGWLADMVVENNFGYFANPLNPGSVSLELNKAFTESRKELYGKRALNFAKNNFNRKALYLNFQEFLEDIYND